MEGLSIARREISESIKSLFRTHSTDSRGRLKELLLTVVPQAFLFKRTFKEWQRRRFWNWDANVKVAIIGIGKLRIGGPKTKEILVRLLEDRWRGALGA